MNQPYKLTEDFKKFTRRTFVHKEFNSYFMQGQFPSEQDEIHFVCREQKGCSTVRYSFEVKNFSFSEKIKLATLIGRFLAYKRYNEHDQQRVQYAKSLLSKEIYKVLMTANLEIHSFELSANAILKMFSGGGGWQPYQQKKYITALEFLKKINDCIDNISFLHYIQVDQKTKNNSDTYQKVVSVRLFTGVKQG